MGKIEDVTLHIYRSAFKHGCSAADIEQAFTIYVCEIIENDDPRKVIRLGFDTSGRLLEIGAMMEGEPRIFHAMKARSKYVAEIERRM